MKPLFLKTLLRTLARGAGAVLVIAATTVLLQPFQSYLATQIIALLYLLPIMICTVLWGLTPGVLAGFSAFLAFNYFYIAPYNTLFVHQTQDVITLAIFLVVAVVISQLLGQAQSGIQLARSREWEATRMYELISALAGLKDIRSIARELASRSQETFDFDYVEVFVPARAGESALTAAVPGETPFPPPPAATYPLQTARGVEGELRAWCSRPQLTAQETRLLEAFTSQGALAIERIRLTRGEYKARILEESDQLKSSLLNSVSHELRTPLSAIKAAVSSLRAGAVDWESDARHDLLSMIEEETDQLNALVGNLLDMSRIEAKALKPHQRWNDLEEIAGRVANKMRKQLAHHRLELNFPKDLPLVPTDFVMIEQVFTNLISNSIKYGPEGTRIAIEACKEGEALHIKVANQGPPVPQEHLERIFDKFYRMRESENVTGTGLGLSICKGIVEEHGGRIWAENDPPWFVFHFTLPLTLDGSPPPVPQEELDE